MSSSIEKIGERICALRKQCAMTQEALGERLGVSGQAVSKWENGGIPDTYFLPLLAEVFSVTTDELLGIEPSTKVFTKENLFRILSNSYNNEESEIADDCFEAVWAILQRISHSSGLQSQKYNKFSNMQVQNVGKNAVNSENFTDNGVVYISFSKDFPLLWAVKDADGLTERLLSNKNMWQFLDDLGNADFRRLLLFSQSIEKSKLNLMTIDFLSNTLGIPAEHMQNLADKLVFYSLMLKRTVKIDEKDIELYEACENCYLLPMLMLASLVCPLPGGDTSVCSYYHRDKPFFDREAIDSALKNGEI